MRQEDLMDYDSSLLSAGNSADDFSLDYSVPSVVPDYEYENAAAAPGPAATAAAAAAAAAASAAIGACPNR